MSGPAAQDVPLTAAVADFVVGADPGSLPEAALDLAERALVDTVGVTLAAAGDPTLVALWAATGRRLPDGPCEVLTHGRSTQPVDAALHNGTAAHALDYDDVLDDLIGHPSAVLVPAALAAAQEAGAGGRALLDAYCVGYQVECALAAGMSIDRHYAQGWHSTATLGVLASAAVTARLLRLGRREVRHALGIAGSLAGGSRRNFGTMTKPLHAGLAASDGVFAGLLAADGFTADAELLEAPLGYLALYGQEPRPGAAQTVLDGEWLPGRLGLNVKRFPCCYYAHRAAGAALALVEDGLAASDVDKVVVSVHPDGLGPLIHHTPTTGLQGKFSLEYVVAACLLDGGLTLDSFTDEAVNRPEAQRLLSAVAVEERPDPPVGPPEWQGAYAVVAAQGRRGAVARRADVPPGHATTPLREEELEAKFRDCVAHAGVVRDHDGLYRRLRSARHEESVGSLLGTALASGVST
ncbi:MAG: MmgE/PrpD family protein [Actinomycetes bacterium]